MDMNETRILPEMQFPMHMKLNEQNELVQPFATKDDEESERQHIQKVQKAFQYYKKYANLRLNKTAAFISSLSKDDQRLLMKYTAHLDSVRTCIDRNQAIIKEILRDRILYPDGGVSPPQTEYELDAAPTHVRHGDMEQNDETEVVEPLKILKAQSTLKLIARDWSADGAIEREQSYKPIIDAIEEYYNPNDYCLNAIKILVPGAGLGRLTYELACRGYSCEGNEFSYFMLMASNFVLNLCDNENKYVLYPWVHQYVNNMRHSDQVAAVRFPDVCPLKNPPRGNIEMAAGDFLEVYKTSNSYNCVATCFFIDCANNVIDFIRTIYKILTPGGIWVNLGPLLYHYSDVSGHNSIEPTYEDLVFIMENIGFDILNSRTGIHTQYAQNPQSMKQSAYESLFWVCKKPNNNEKQQQQQQLQQQQRNSNPPMNFIMHSDSDTDINIDNEQQQQQQQEQEQPIQDDNDDTTDIDETEETMMHTSDDKQPTTNDEQKEP